MKHSVLTTFVAAIAMMASVAMAGSDCAKSTESASYDSAKSSCAKACSKSTTVDAAAEGGEKAVCTKGAEMAEAKACSASNTVENVSASSCSKPCAKSVDAAAEGGEKAVCTMGAEMVEAKSCSEACKAACGAGGDAMQVIQAAAEGKAAKPEAGKAYKVGHQVDDFALPSAKDGETKKLSALAGEKATLLVFWNQDCPYVVECQDRVNDFAAAYGEKGVKVIAIDAGIDKPVEKIQEHAADKNFEVLVNREGDIASRFGATRTPEVFLLSPDMEILYHGAFDSGRSVNPKTKERDTFAQDAVEAVLKGEKPMVAETRAFGCSIKYAKGVQPMT
ncbi:MAG: redoxin domain-containing protein [Sumerlaeia bacterium]